MKKSPIRPLEYFLLYIWGDSFRLIDRPKQWNIWRVKNRGQSFFCSRRTGRPALSKPKGRTRLKKAVKTPAGRTRGRRASARRLAIAIAGFIRYARQCTCDKALAVSRIIPSPTRCTRFSRCPTGNPNGLVSFALVLSPPGRHGRRHHQLQGD